MPRTLPWLVGAADKKSARLSSPAPRPKKRAKRDSSPEDLVDSDLNDFATPPPQEKKKKKDAGREPSTSPALPSPPSVEYMRPGYDADDLFMMVEDEFCSTAKTFTRHLHFKEYARYKRMATSRGKETLGKLDRGTDGVTEQSGHLQMRKEREAADRKKEDALGRESSEEEDPYLQDPQLADLMAKGKDRVVRKELSGMVKAKVKTRAAAGFSQSPHTAKRHRDALEEEKQEKPAKASSSKVAAMFEEESDDEEEDDLDAAPKASQPSFRRPEPKRHDADSRNRNDLPRERVPLKPKNDGIFKRFAEPSEKAPSSLSTTKVTNDAATQAHETLLQESPPLERKRPTYQKALNRQASQIKVEPEDYDKHAMSRIKPSSETFRSSTQSSRDSRPRPDECNGSRFLSGGESAAAEPAAKSTTTSSRPASNAQTSPTRDPIHEATNGYLARSAARRAKGMGQQQGKAKRVDDIPTFLY